MSLVIINGTDISEHILADSYNVNEENRYEQWEDANGVLHRILLRSRVKGSFSMKFKTETAYNTFVELLNTSKRVDGSIMCSVYVNNMAGFKAGDYFYTLTATMRRSIDTGKKYSKVQFKIEER